MKLKPIVAATSLIGFVGANVSTAEEIQLTQSVTLSGSVAVESRFNEDFKGNDSSGFVVDTAFLGIESQVHESVKANIGLLYEGAGRTDFTLDDAYLTLGNSKTAPVYLTVGQFYLPFGGSSPNMITDSLTTYMGELFESAVQINFNAAGVYGSVFVFNGETQDSTEEKIDQYGLNIGYALESESFGVDVGMSYINNMGDTDYIRGFKEDLDGNKDNGDEYFFGTDPGYKYVDGMGVHLVLNTGPFSFFGEYLTALDKFNAKNGSALYGKEPSAWNIELAYVLNLAGKEMTMALGYQGSDEAALAIRGDGGSTSIPEARYLLGLSMGIYENTKLSLEYSHDRDYDKKDGGTGENADNLTLQVAVEF